MKISELIVVLAQQLQKHGDIDVVKGCGEKVEPITKAAFIKGPATPLRLI